MRVVGGHRFKINGRRGGWLKLKSRIRLPSTGAFSRTSGRESGRPSVAGLEPRSAEEAVFDELEVGIEGQLLVVDEALSGVRADD